MSLSSTVKAHRAQVMEKLEMSSLAELVRVGEKVRAHVSHCVSVA
jgi:FixJ family two-component response regulator